MVRAYPTFGNATPVACFTESTPSALRSLIGPRYTACGIGFKKDVVFQAGGEPSFSVRGDHWAEVDAVPAAMRPFCTRFWPGVYTTSWEEFHELPTGTETESQWAHERKWRVEVRVPGRVSFRLDQIAFSLSTDSRTSRWADTKPPGPRTTEIPVGGQLISR